MPYRQFVSGEVLTASNVMNFLANQAVITCATSASRPTSPTTGMVVYLQDSKVLQVYDGAAWQQIYPVIGAGITDGTIGTVDLADGAVTSAKIADGTITGSDIAGSTITPSNVANGTYGISISGNAATASSASNSSLVSGFSATTSPSPSTVVVRDGNADIDIRSVLIGSAGFLQCPYTSNGFIFRRDDAVILAQITPGAPVFSTIPGGSTKAMYINSSGVIGVNTSSERYKKDIEDANLSNVLELRPRHFRYKAEYANGEDTVHLGLIAEEVAALGLEDLIYRNEAGEPESVAYELVAVALIDVIKDLAARVEALEGK